MKTSAILTHVAILVPSLDKAVRHVTELGLDTNPFEEFDHEGTCECYVGSPDKSSRLLLLEAIKDGPYRRALEKRGPGLHHLGVQVANLEDYAEQLGKSGWLLHTKSLVTIRKSQTVYFARPGTPYLVEAREHIAVSNAPSIESLQIFECEPSTALRTQALGISNTQVVVSSNIRETHLTIEGCQISLVSLTGERGT